MPCHQTRETCLFSCKYIMASMRQLSHSYMKSIKEKPHRQSLTLMWKALFLGLYISYLILKITLKRSNKNSPKISEVQRNFFTAQGPQSMVQTRLDPRQFRKHMPILSQNIATENQIPCFQEHNRQTEMRELQYSQDNQKSILLYFNLQYYLF